MIQSNYKILVVDDEEDIVEFVSYNLKKEGFNVSSARNGVAAVQLAKEFHPHLILLDIMMPDFFDSKGGGFLPNSRILCRSG